MSFPEPQGCFLTSVPKAAEILRVGGLVAFPTETVYGLGADAQNAEAVARIFEVKKRPLFDPLIVHVHSAEAASNWVMEWPDLARQLAAAFWPGPLTLVLKKSGKIPDLVTAGQETVGIRVPEHPMAQALLALAGPVAAPSANLFGRVSPTTAQHVVEQLGKSIDGILDGGPCSVGVESTVVAISSGVAVLLRPGGIPLEALEEIVGAVRIPAAETQRDRSPGRLEAHYAPTTPLVLASDIEHLDLHGQRIGRLTFGTGRKGPPAEVHFDLSPTCDLREAARRLFSGLRVLDTENLDLVVADPVPEHGLGLAIMDRLRRAAAAGGFRRVPREDRQTGHCGPVDPFVP
jgi:L-threonylcarbamoyladenylate synthase